MVKDEEKAEVLIIFIALVFSNITKTSCSLDTQFSVLEDRDREQNKAL